MIFAWTGRRSRKVAETRSRKVAETRSVVADEGARKQSAKEGA